MFVIVIVVVIMIVFVQEVGIDFQFGVQIEVVQVENCVDWCFIKIGGVDWGVWVYMQQVVVQCVYIVGGYQIVFGDEDGVGKVDLVLCFFLFVELYVVVFGVDQCDDGIQQVVVCDFVVYEECLCDWVGVGDIGSFDDYVVELDLVVIVVCEQVG